LYRYIMVPRKVCEVGHTFGEEFSESASFEHSYYVNFARVNHPGAESWPKVTQQVYFPPRPAADSGTTLEQQMEQMAVTEALFLPTMAGQMEAVRKAEAFFKWLTGGYNSNDDDDSELAQLFQEAKDSAREAQGEWL
jgi:hypothetical protein